MQGWENRMRWESGQGTKAGVSPLQISPVIHRTGWWDGLTRSFFPRMNAARTPGSARIHPSAPPLLSLPQRRACKRGKIKKGENAKGGNAKHPAPGPVLPGALGTERIALPLGRVLLDEQEPSTHTHTARSGGQKAPKTPQLLSFLIFKPDTLCTCKNPAKPAVLPSIPKQPAIRAPRTHRGCPQPSEDAEPPGTAF